MKVQLGLVVWFALAIALVVLSHVWPPARYVLVSVGAISVAFTGLFVGWGVIQDVRSTVRMRRYEQRMDREREEFLAQRARFSRREDQ